MVFEHFCFKVAANSIQPRLGLIVPRTYGSAPKRNLFKRWHREAFRLRYSQLPNIDVVVMPKRGLKTASWQAVQADWQALLSALRAEGGRS